MIGNSEIIDHLNRLLTGELTAMDVYFVQSRMCENWGLKSLHAQFAHEFEDEKNHTASLIERILFLEGLPDLSKRDAYSVGKDVKEILENDLQLEYEVVKNIKATIKLCEEKKDFVTREILQKLLDDTEQDHIFWIESQLGLIEKVGIENYLQTKMHDGAAQQ